ncbi:hypothetical protein, partial [Apibacter mensalis]|uniref:hypothetical protein n=1 Tax=Apibacter mensalis TaxID=1586267 RepID=UPI001C8763FE
MLLLKFSGKEWMGFFDRYLLEVLKNQFLKYPFKTIYIKPKTLIVVVPSRVIITASDSGLQNIKIIININ